jgi:hypothetical protein
MSTANLEDSVRRLVDIVVEEVSLVDRAANGRRFLVVKRGAPMDLRELEKADGVGGGAESEASAEVGQDSALTNEPAEEEFGKAEGSLLEVAVAALERLTETVETLGTLGDNGARVPIAQIAGDLRALAEQLVEAAGGGGEEEETSSDPEKVSDIVGVLETVRSALQQVGTLIDRGKAVKATPKKGPVEEVTSVACKGAAPQRFKDDLLGAHLHRLCESLAKIALSVHEQSQRLTRLEKSFGLPHSTPAKEGSRGNKDEDVGWPMDLNRQCSRESVDKAVSFHEL